MLIVLALPPVFVVYGFALNFLDATIDTGVISFLFVCDQDDPGAPSPLLSATMPLDARFDG